jgi:hypothetical protein
LIQFILLQETLSIEVKIIPNKRDLAILNIQNFAKFRIQEKSVNLLPVILFCAAGNFKHSGSETFHTLVDKNVNWSKVD